VNKTEKKVNTETNFSEGDVPVQSEITAIIGRGADFEGRLIFEGIVRIDGNFKGEIFTRDTLILGPDSKVQAQIDADTVLVAGYMEGEIRATNRVEIHPTGYVRGSIHSPVLRIEEGGMFDGTTQMQPSSSSQTV
jgi:cytoskeletal protein CcmA (bactofilin family)